MSPDGQAYLTREGLEKLKQELKELKTVKRKDIAARIQDAKELGDLSENAEYAEAKDQQAFTEGRIIELENTIKNAQVISEENTGGIVHIGSTIKISSDQGEKTYTIVGSNEASPAAGLISNESPLGQALIGGKVGDTVDLKVPKGTAKYKILSVS
jgi:transcription elongation factor GreA